VAFAPVGFFVLRTPLLPFDELAALTGGRDAARERLRAIVGRPDVREALFLASPSLDADIDRWLREPASERTIKAERALVRYACRMTGRATPFGLFSGCSVGTTGGPVTALALEPIARDRRHTRLDMYYVCALAEAIARIPALRDEWTYRPSSSLYAIAGELRYAEAVLANGARDYHLAVVERTPHLDATLERARAGANLAELAAALVADDAEVELAEARAFVNQLIDAQLLVPDVEPTVTGPESIAAVLAALDGKPALAPIATALRAATDELAALDARGLGQPTSTYRALADALGELPVKPDLPRLFQVDMVKSSPDAVIGDDVMAEIRRGVDALFRMTSSADPMAGFRAAFEARYGARELPLAEALDEDNGIGFETPGGAGAEGSPLLRGLAFGRGGGYGAFIGRDQWLLRKLEQLWRDGHDELVLDDADVAALTVSDRAPLPDSFAAMVQVAMRSAGEFRVFVEHAAGPSAATLLGRFCHADSDLHHRVAAMVRTEAGARPDAVYAEIVHLPEGRIGNIVSRPVLRDYELVFLGASGAPRDRQIELADLLVRVEGARVVLRSRRLDKDVVPRLSNAHNYAVRSLGAYRFLCALQRQGVSSVAAWTWGALGGSSRLPRVTIGRTVLATRSWSWDGPTVASLKAVAAKPFAEQRGVLDRLRERDGIPRWIALVDGDNALPIDLESELLVDTFLQTVKQRDAVRIGELFAAPDELCTTSPEGRFVHEIIVPFASEPAPATAVRTTPRASRTRSYPPGSSWIFAKLFAGPASVDRVLRETIAPLVAELRDLGALDRPWSWFFIRYGDPSWHLRLRVGGDPTWLHAEALPRITAAARAELARGTVHNFQLDTYEPEVERYGGDAAIAIAEQLFCADSDAVLAMLPLFTGERGADARWKLTLVGMDRLLGDFGLPLDHKLAIARACRAGFASEFGAGATFEHMLGDRFRADRRELESLLAPRGDDDPLAPAWHAFAARSMRVAPLGRELAELARAGTTTASLDDIVASHLHMHANRMLRSAAREQELVIHDYLVRLYESQLARARKRPA
jgi:thiopeptide-type bacteriocin biosynthesis protein